MPKKKKASTKNKPLSGKRKKNHTNFPQKSSHILNSVQGWQDTYLSIYNAIFCFPYIDLGTSFVEFWIHNQTWHIHTKKLHMVTHPTSFGKGKDNGLIKRERRRKSTHTFYFKYLICSKHLHWMFIEFRFKYKGMQQFTPARSSQLMKCSSLDNQTTAEQQPSPHLKEEQRAQTA